MDVLPVFHCGYLPTKDLHHPTHLCRDKFRFHTAWLGKRTTHNVMNENELQDITKKNMDGFGAQLLPPTDVTLISIFG